MIDGNHTGMYSWARALAATLSMKEIVLCISHLNRVKSHSSSTKHHEEIKCVFPS